MAAVLAQAVTHTRQVAVWLHRYVGLAIAAFIGTAGLTGAVLAYNDPLRDALIPVQFVATARGPLLSLATLDARVMAYAPTARITQWPLRLRAGREAEFDVAGTIDPRTHLEAPLAFDALHVDPVSGRVIGVSLGDEGAPAAQVVLDFVYRLHYSLALPGRIGYWIMGTAAVLWFVDCFVGAWLTLPRRPPMLPKWKLSWQVQRRRLNYDLHRAGGLWLWGMLVMLALSSVQMNLSDELFMPVARQLLTLSPDLVAAHRPDAAATPIAPADAAAIALREAAARHWVDAPERLQHDDEHGVYRAIFTTPADQWTTARRREIYLDDRHGAIVQVTGPGQGTPGDVALDWLGALHEGGVFGWPYKLILCVTGLGVAVLCVTGVVVWWRKRQARNGQAGNRMRRQSSPASRMAS